jgi:hypothetical protein
MRQHQFGEAGVVIAERRDIVIVVNARITIDFTGTATAPLGAERIAAVNAHDTHSVPLLVLELVPGDLAPFYVWASAPILRFPFFDGPGKAMRAVRQIRAAAAGLPTNTAASRPAFFEVCIHAEKTEAVTNLFPTETDELLFTNATFSRGAVDASNLDK